MANPFSNVNAEALGGIAVNMSRAICDLREVTKDWTKKPEEMSANHRDSFLITLGKLLGLFKSLEMLGAQAVGDAIVRVEGLGYNEYVLRELANFNLMGKADPTLQEINAAVHKRMGFKEKEVKEQQAEKSAA